jgi:low temperature requirement protein LtrA
MIVVLLWSIIWLPVGIVSLLVAKHISEMYLAACLAFIIYVSPFVVYWETKDIEKQGKQK